MRLILPREVVERDGGGKTRRHPAPSTEERRRRRPHDEGCKGGSGAGGAAAQRWAAPGGQESDVSGKQPQHRVGLERLATLYTQELRKCLAVILYDVVFSALEWLL